LLGIIAACALTIFIGVFLWKKAKPSLSFKGRIWTGIFAAIALTACFALPQFESVLEWLTTHGMEHPIVTQFEPRASARNNGLLADWAISAAEQGMRRPDRYSRSEIDRIARSYQRDARSPQDSHPAQPINLIMYVIESFMDPMDLGVRYTSDPVPTFHAICRNNSSGRIVVPVFGGASANTEFELLTGLSMYFLPSSSCPYRQSISRDIPSLPRALHQNGYRTMAIVADPPYLFNRTAVFGHLGFDRWLFPATDPNVPRSPSPEFAADDAIADAVIAASRGSSPFFIYAFPSGSHFPWDYDDYKDSKLDLVNPMPEPSRSRLKTYVNALNVVDKSLKKLIDHFSKSDQRTAIFVMGDHLPALAEVYDQTKFFNVPGTAKIQKRYSVPAAIWCNWPAAKEDFNFSANFTAVRLLHVLGLQPTGSLALNADVRSHYSVLSQYISTADGRLLLPHADDLPFKSLLEDYSTIQYDLLEGKRYSLAHPGW
jgi:phosphoglycerol transferase MdoB-like AlkP superfamily enzyme